MIESGAGVREVEAICSNDAVTAVFIGPVDLRLSLGFSGGDGDEPAYLEVLDRLMKTCRSAGKPIGIFAAGSNACRKRIAQGFDFLLVSFYRGYVLHVGLVLRMITAPWRSGLVSCRRQTKLDGLREWSFECSLIVDRGSKGCMYT